MLYLSAQKIFQILKGIDWSKERGYIQFNLASTNVIINTTDIVGNTLQSWLKQFFINNQIYFREPINTQEFPDFFLGENNTENLLEVKSFQYFNSPAFDIANFESYCDSIKDKPYRLEADYLVFGYEMSNIGEIFIKDIWLEKIWELAGISKNYPLKVQVKREVIYNIRPSSHFKIYKQQFKSKHEFIQALYETLKLYRGPQIANEWFNTFKSSYFSYYGIEFII